MEEISKIDLLQTALLEFRLNTGKEPSVIKVHPRTYYGIQKEMYQLSSFTEDNKFYGINIDTDRSIEPSSFYIQ